MLQPPVQKLLVQTFGEQSSVVSAGQPALEPVQLAGRTATVPLWHDGARHSNELGRNASNGQLVATPSQVSATSQTPADRRQVVPALPAGCVHVLRLPLQMSSVQALLSVVQAVFAAFFWSAGQLDCPLTQLSGRSHSPPAARHAVPPRSATAVHVPDWQTLEVQTLPSSLQAVPLVLDGFEQTPLPAWQLPGLWHSFSALQADTVQQMPFVQKRPETQSWVAEQTAPWGAR
jgi:hypothetical protein